MVVARLRTPNGWVRHRTIHWGPLRVHTCTNNISLFFCACGTDICCLERESSRLRKGHECKARALQTPPPTTKKCDNNTTKKSSSFCLWSLSVFRMDPNKRRNTGTASTAATTNNNSNNKYNNNNITTTTTAAISTMTTTATKSNNVIWPLGRCSTRTSAGGVRLCQPPVRGKTARAVQHACVYRRAGAGRDPAREVRSLSSFDHRFCPVGSVLSTCRGTWYM